MLCFFQYKSAINLHISIGINGIRLVIDCKICNYFRHFFFAKEIFRFIYNVRARKRNKIEKSEINFSYADIFNVKSKMIRFVFIGICVCQWRFYSFPKEILVLNQSLRRLPLL